MIEIVKVGMATHGNNFNTSFCDFSYFGLPWVSASLSRPLRMFGIFDSNKLLTSPENIKAGNINGIKRKTPLLPTLRDCRVSWS